jgi:hypothetical protein
MLALIGLAFCLGCKVRSLSIMPIFFLLLRVEIGTSIAPSLTLKVRKLHGLIACGDFLRLLFFGLGGGFSPPNFC